MLDKKTFHPERRTGDLRCAVRRFPGPATGWPLPARPPSP